MNKILALGLVGLFTACGGGTPCEQYVDAAQACADDYAAASTATGTTSATTSTDFCADDDGANDDYYTCAADAYDAADCATDDGIMAAVLADMACGLGTTTSTTSSTTTSSTTTSGS